MKSSYGDNLKLTIFGTSHAPEIGMTLEGIPAGLPVNMEALQQFMDRRAPGRNEWSTTRKEADIPHFLSGFTDGVTTGETIHAVIYNENVRRSDYDELKYIPRPGHADYAAWRLCCLDEIRPGLRYVRRRPLLRADDRSHVHRRWTMQTVAGEDGDSYRRADSAYRGLCWGTIRPY